MATSRIAVAVVMALAAATAAGCAVANNTAPNSAASAGSAAAGSAAPASHAASSSGTSSDTEEPIPSSVPRDYVTIDPAGARRLIVRATVTGAVVATVSAPPGSMVMGVYGSDDDQVFAFGTLPVAPTPAGIWNWYVLRLRPRAAPEVTHLSYGRSDPTGVAVSPDGSKLAMAFTFRTYPPSPQPVTIYSVATGAALRTWTVTSGIIGAADPMANGDLGQEAAGIAMRWTADGRGLAFAFHANAAPGKAGYGYNPVAAIRLLDTTAPGSDLMKNSRELASADFGYNPGNGAGTRCLAGSGWSVSSDGRGVTCAAEWTLPSEQSAGQFQPGTRPAGCPGAPATSHPAPHQVEAGFWRQYWLPGGGGEGDTIYGVCPVATSAGIHLAWASPDGKTVLGALDPSGHPMFGLFSAGQSHALPAPPASIPWNSIAW